jgi:subtilisin family serine protease
LVLNPDVNLAGLPVVAVLDSGVIFPSNFENLVVQHWIAPGSNGGDAKHGTSVAGNAVFRYIAQNIQENVITPRARIIDCNILDGKVSMQNFIKRIQDAVAEFFDVAKIYNLSANSDEPIEGDSMSIVGYELDVLQMQKGVQFVISAGNHDLWKTQKSLEDVIDDDDSRIAVPADSLYSIAVGAITGETHGNSLSAKNYITSYSRIGPGFKGMIKPDMCAYAGTITDSGETPVDSFSLCLTHEGMLAPNAGTSMSAPIVAGDLAEILGIIPDNEPLLAKALLFHTALPLWDAEDMTEEQIAFIHNLYGRGLPNVEESKFSSSSKAAFVRTGVLNRTTKERVTIYMPPILAAQAGRNIARVTVTCISAPPVDVSRGTEYLGAYIRTSLQKSAGDSINLRYVNPDFKESREKWDICQYISKPFSRFYAGDWQVWLELFGRWDKKDVDVRYALVVTIEDVSGTLDIYSEIQQTNRYRPINEIRVRLAT